MLGNKCDLNLYREVTHEEAEKLSSELDIKFMETSARRDVNAEEAFTVLVADMITQEESRREFCLIKEHRQEFSLYKNYERMMMSFNIDSNRSMEETFKVESAFIDILRYGVEENYHIRVMVVGNEDVGKSTLVRRLLKKQETS